jgi:hypothetical protein
MDAPIVRFVVARRSGVLSRRAIKRLVAGRRQEKAPLDGGQRGFSDRKLG